MKSLLSGKEASNVGNLFGFCSVCLPSEEAAKLESQGVHIIIALGHSGYEKDKQIAAQCRDVDLVIGGHCKSFIPRHVMMIPIKIFLAHTFLYSGQAPDIEMADGEYPTWVTQESGRRVPVVQAYAFTKYLGYLRLGFDDEGNLTGIDGQPILLDSNVPQDQDFLNLIESYRPGVFAAENEIIGTTKVLLDGSCRRNECNLGNFITDAMVDWFASRRKSSEHWTDASIAFLQGGGIRASIDDRSSGGNITKEDVETVMPFGNKMEVVEITGKALLEALEHSVHRYTDGERRGEFLQMSGVEVVYDMSKQSGQRVVDVKVRCAYCPEPAFQEIDETKKYKVVMTDILADGGDGYEMFKGGVVEKFSQVIDADVFMAYVKKESPIDASVENRITITDSHNTSQDKNHRQGERNSGTVVNGIVRSSALVPLFLFLGNYRLSNPLP